MRRLIFTLFAATGCASVANPPGGPEDLAPPQLVRVTPDSGATGVSAPRVVFEFDEVISDRGTGPAALERLVVISPGLGTPRVSWHRNAISARPREGWRPNTTYSVTLLPGIRDLRGNVSTEAETIVFSTGPTLASAFIEGRLFDWMAERPAPRGWIEAVSVADTTLRYAAPADTLGRFLVGPLDGGRYLVRGWNDANANRMRDRAEIWDSAYVDLPAAQRRAVELLGLIRDTLPPRLATVTAPDSVTIIATFDRALDPAQQPSAAGFRVVRQDSTVVPIAAVAGARAFEGERARADSIRRAEEAAALDTARVARPPAELPRAVTPADTAPPTRPSRPPPEISVAITLATPLQDGTSYRVEAIEVRGVDGLAGSSSRVLTVTARRAEPEQPQERRAAPDARPPSGRPTP